MRSVPSSTVARLIMFVAAVGLWTAPVAAQAPPSRAVAASTTDKLRADRPIYRVGDTWARTDGVYELVRIDKDVYVFSGGPGKECYLTKDLGVARIVLDGRTELDIDPPPRLGWPLELGKWGVGRATWRSPPPRPLVQFTGAVNISWQVDAAEDLVTGAGTFRTLRIVQKIETVSGAFGGSGQLFGQFFLWYAPDVQRFVKAEGNLKGLSWELAGTARPPAPPVVASPPPAPLRPEPALPAAPSPVAIPAPAPPPATPPPVAAVPRGDTQAPKITINYPPPDARVGEETVLITGLVTDNVDVVRIQVLVNGVEATPLREVGVMGRGVPLSALAPLKPGPNVIEVIATDRAGNVAQVLRTVVRVVAVPAPGPAPTSAVPRR